MSLAQVICGLGLTCDIICAVFLNLTRDLHRTFWHSFLVGMFRPQFGLFSGIVKLLHYNYNRPLCVGCVSIHPAPCQSENRNTFCMWHFYFYFVLKRCYYRCCCWIMGGITGPYCVRLFHFDRAQEGKRGREGGTLIHNRNLVRCLLLPHDRRRLF